MTTVALVLLLASPVPEAAVAPPLSPSVPFSDRLHDSLSVVAWPLSLGSSDATPLAVVAGGFFLLRHDVRLYRSFDRNVRWSFRRRSVFDLTVHLGDGLVNLAVFGAFALGDARAVRTSIEGIQALLSVAATSVLTKHVFRVARPSTNPDRKSYFGRFNHDAFPSGHTMSAFATAAVIAAEYPRAAPYAYAGATLVGASVMKRRWHWPSDVVVGGALGYLIGRASIAINSHRLRFAPIPGGLGAGGDI